jgi:hypothetical protein
MGIGTDLAGFKDVRVLELEIVSLENYVLKMPAELAPALMGLYYRKGTKAKHRRCELCLQFLPGLSFDTQKDSTNHPFDVFRRFIQELFARAAKRAEAENDDSPSDAAAHEDALVKELYSVLFPNLAAGLVQAARAGLWKGELATVLSELTGDACMSYIGTFPIRT